MKFALRRLLLTALILSAIVYAAEEIAIRASIPTGYEFKGQVMVEHSDAVKLKNGRTDYYFDAPAPEDCLHTFFPHQGLKPCWYLLRHTDQQRKIDASPKTVFPQN